MRVPAICNTCGSLFPSGFNLQPGATDAAFVGCDAGPCPNCGGDGSIPDGIYNLIGNTIRILSQSSQTTAQLQRLAAILKETYQSKASVTSLEERLEKDLPELSSFRDALPKTRNELYAFIAIALTIIMMLIGQLNNKGDKKRNITVNQVINNIYTENKSK